jgi:dipeptidyl-peptidase III
MRQLRNLKQQQRRDSSGILSPEPQVGSAGTYFSRNRFNIASHIHGGAVMKKIASTLLLFVLFGCSQSQTAPENAAAQPQERRYLLERVDDAAVVQAYADDFSALPLQEKELIWHLYQAALAGRDIYYDQRYAHSIEMREVVEGILTHSSGVEAATLSEIQRYTKLFWINNGPYNNLTARKFVLKSTPEAFALAATKAAANGARFPTAGGESLDGLLQRLQPFFFDAAVDPIVTNKTPDAGQDILQASANNLYVNVSMKEAAAFKDKYPLNSRLVKKDGRLTEEPYSASGRYAPQIAEIIKHLEAAVPLASEPMAKALKALIKVYQTAETADRLAYDIAWVEDKDSKVDTINYFTEVYLDARGIKGAWEALVFYVNPRKTEGIKKLASDAQWFEDRMPWQQKYRKQGVKGITANAIEVVIEMGDSGPVTPIGINLPNDESVREHHGSKSVSLSNITEAYDKSTPSGFRNEFSWSPEEAARSEKWGSLAGELLTNMHEVIGHASGRVSERLNGRPQDALKEQFSALEEARADMVGLYYLADPKLAELGLLPAADQEEITKAEYEGYTRNAIVQLRRVKEGSQLAEDHMRNRQMVVHWIKANTKAIEERTRDGKTFYVMVDAKAFHEGVGKLLAEVQRIKAEGDHPAAKKLFDTYGIHFDPKLRDQVIARVEKLNLPSYSGFVMPKLTPVKDANGKITDVKISYPQSLTAQMLEYAEATRATREKRLGK